MLKKTSLDKNEIKFLKRVLDISGKWHIIVFSAKRTFMDLLYIKKINGFSYFLVLILVYLYVRELNSILLKTEKRKFQLGVQTKQESLELSM